MTSEEYRVAAVIADARSELAARLARLPGRTENQLQYLSRRRTLQRAWAMHYTRYAIERATLEMAAEARAR